MAFKKAEKKEKKQSQKNIELKPEVNLDNQVADVFDFFVPDAFVEDKDDVYLGRNTYVRAYALSVYPRETYIGWLDEFFSLGNVRITAYCENIPDNIVIRQLTSKVVSAQAHHDIYQKRGEITELPVLRNVIRDLESVREAIQTNRERMFLGKVFITIYAKDKQSLEDKCIDFENICSRKSILPLSLTLRQREGFVNSLPIGVNTINKYSKNLTTGSVAALMPISNPDMSHDSGIWLGENFYSRAPVFYNRFIGPPHLPTQHFFVTGMSGAGKSTALKIIIARSAAIRQRTVVFDHDKNEYKKLIKELLGGEYIEIRPGEMSGLNPLDIEEQYDPDNKRFIVDIYEKITEIRAIIGSIMRYFAGRPLTPLEMSSLEEASREIYTDLEITSDPESLYTTGGVQVGEGKFSIGKVKKKMPIWTTLHTKLQTKRNTEELCDMLKPLLSGGSLGMFDCETTRNINSIVIGFGLKDLKEHFAKFYANLCLFNFTKQKFIQKDDLEKTVINDESWMWIKTPETAEFLEESARTFRKYNASLGVGTQMMEEFVSREQGRAVINQCSTHILLQQKPQVIKDIMEFLNLSSGCASLLESFAPGEALLSLNGSVTAIRIIPTAFERPYVFTNYSA